MNRSHTVQFYMDLIAKIRKARPDILLSGDFIVGFPGETDADFASTLRLVSDIGYAQAYSFKYSPRPGTPAAGSEEQLPEDVRRDRLESLQQLLRAQQQAFNQEQLGRTLPVLIEGEGRTMGQLVGRSPFLQPVHFDAPVHHIGQLTEVRIDEGLSNSLRGTLLDVIPQRATV